MSLSQWTGFGMYGNLIKPHICDRDANISIKKVVIEPFEKQERHM